jgi:hypothetical protein
MAECLVLPGLYGVLVQGLLFLCCVMTLVCKKVREGAQRTWWEFGLDSSKQFVGAGCLHVLNLVCAEKMSPLKGGDECEWYWINIMVDTTLGVLVEYWFLSVITRLIETQLSPEAAAEFKTGEYYVDGVFHIARYFKQLSVWLLVVIAMKFSMVLFMLLLNAPLLATSKFILQPFLTTPSLKLLVVMIATPLFMNSLQFWLVDNFIKKRQSRCEGEVAAATGELEPLMPGATIAEAAAARASAAASAKSA